MTTFTVETHEKIQRGVISIPLTPEAVDAHGIQGLQDALDHLLSHGIQLADVKPYVVTGKKGKPVAFELAFETTQDAAVPQFDLGQLLTGTDKWLPSAPFIAPYPGGNPLPYTISNDGACGLTAEPIRSYNG